MADNSKDSKKHWDHIKHDLTSALDSWEELSKRPEQLSVQDKKLQEMKQLLEELKVKINDLSKP
jgi:5-bromo-4-chloroindolyl phosphate hydrolysis protein